MSQRGLVSIQHILSNIETRPFPFLPFRPLSFLETVHRTIALFKGGPFGPISWISFIGQR